MSTQGPPVIPPRPSRSPAKQDSAYTSSPDIPTVPPRPSRRADRSASPIRDSYAPSPLNELPPNSTVNRIASSDVPHRPPSVTLPSLGEEGKEYEDLDAGTSSDSHHQAPTETRNVGADLKLHAPRPSLPSSSANAKVQAVTRTDSRQAAAAGLNSTESPVHHEQERPNRSERSRSHSRENSSTASSNRRQTSRVGDEHSIPEIGQRVPMYPNAGDVQAPSPSPYVAEHGVYHHRTRSGHEGLPPGSYGLHGHGVPPSDRFEKAWYEKHPGEYAKEEQGQYGPGVGGPRPDWALSSDDLNKIVRRSAINGAGIGTSPAVTGTPEEEVGYLASDEYTHRMASPDPDSHGVSHASVESPLRNMSIPASEIEKTQETTNEKETPHETSREEPGVIHVDDPYHSLYHPDGFAPAPPTEKQSHGQGDDNVDDEPILAADEVRPESASLHPAVSPTFDVKESAEHGARSQTPSSARSRPASHHGSVPAPAKYSSCEDIEKHTQLEDVEEYEPLFPEDDNQEKPIAAAERFKKRPDMLKHRFPSEDVWEDSPNSLQLQATVTTPELPKEDLFETPEQEAARKSQTEHVDPHEVASHILESEDHDQKTPERPQIAKQRFPSRDVWEDAPDSQQLVTTIEPPKDDIKSPAAAKSPDVPPKPNIPPRPQRQPQAAPPVDTSSKPTISPTEKKAPPVIPGRPKPQIPARPAKPASMGSSENLTRVTSGGSTSGGEENKPSLAPPTKEKPAVPSRPGGSRIAALKAGFLSDLNSRLQVGPQGPKPQENKEEQPPAEKAPLSDARKGRARGPARRKPANGNKPTQEPVAPKVSAAPEVRITEAWSVWQFDADGDLVVGGEEKAKPNIEPKEPELAAPDVSLSAESTMAPEIVKNTAGEPADPKPTFEREPTQPEIVEPIETTPKLEPTIPPAFAEVTDTSLALEEAPSPTASPMDENKVAPAAPFTLETTAEPTTGTVTESATETASKPDVEVLPEASASATKFDRAPSDTSEMDEAIEKMAPSTDRKKSSDSEVHSPQQSST